MEYNSNNTSREHNAGKELSSEEQELRNALAGRYTIIKKIGSGGMAHVYLAHEISLDRDVAIKLLPKEFQHDKDFSDRFKREAQIAAKLEHPNIIRIFQISDNPGISYFVMNYIHGKSLREHINNRGAVPIMFIGRWGMDICSALSYAHSHGVIHRDLKPDNVMINENGDAIVMDFGIARAAQELRLTRKGQIIGTPHYMSPEQAQGIELDARSDIYSLGVVLYQMATGTLPFQADDITSILYLHVHEKPDSPDKRNPHIPEWLKNCILTCLEKRPQDRFKNVLEVSNALKSHALPSGSLTYLKEKKERTQKWKSGQIIDILSKIPMFKELSIDQIKKIFSICSMSKLAKDEVLCNAGGDSNHLHILISGSLRAVFNDGSILSKIVPLWTVGEMGVFSGEKRSATVIAETESTLLTIHKPVLFGVFREDPTLGQQVLMNVNAYLAYKLRINQAIIEEMKKLCTPKEYNAVVARVLHEEK